MAFGYSCSIFHFYTLQYHIDMYVFIFVKVPLKPQLKRNNQQLFFSYDSWILYGGFKWKKILMCHWQFLWFKLIHNHRDFSFLAELRKWAFSCGFQVVQKLDFFRLPEKFSYLPENVFRSFGVWIFLVFWLDELFFD